MPTKEDKVKINARISQSFYDWIGSEYGNVSQAVNDGLELLMGKSKTSGCNTGDCDTDCDTIVPVCLQNPLGSLVMFSESSAGCVR